MDIDWREIGFEYNFISSISISISILSEAFVPCVSEKAYRVFFPLQLINDVFQPLIDISVKERI